jgi:hypothetical protein
MNNNLAFIQDDKANWLVMAWRRRRNPFWLRIDRDRKRWYAGCNLAIGWFGILWINASRGFGRPSFCIRVLGGKRQFNALFMWDTAHISRMGNIAKCLTPLHSILWFSWTAWTTGTGGVRAVNQGDKWIKKSEH